MFTLGSRVAVAGIAFAFVSSGLLGEREIELQRFVTLVTSSSPKLADFYALYGEGAAEEEAQLVLAACARRGLSETECLQVNRQRESRRHETESLYVLWLRAKLPRKLSVHVRQVKTTSKPSELRTETVWATLDGASSGVFTRILDRNFQGQFGIISLAEINGVPVSDLFLEDLRQGATPDLR
jgi:hypothetical protein